MTDNENLLVTYHFPHGEQLQEALKVCFVGFGIDSSCLTLEMAHGWAMPA